MKKNVILAPINRFRKERETIRLSGQKQHVQSEIIVIDDSGDAPIHHVQAEERGLSEAGKLDSVADKGMPTEPSATPYPTNSNGIFVCLLCFPVHSEVKPRPF